MSAAPNTQAVAPTCVTTGREKLFTCVEKEGQSDEQ